MHIHMYKNNISYEVLQIKAFVCDLIKVCVYDLEMRSQIKAAETRTIPDRFLPKITFTEFSMSVGIYQ